MWFSPAFVDHFPRVSPWEKPTSSASASSAAAVLKTRRAGFGFWLSTALTTRRKAVWKHLKTPLKNRRTVKSSQEITIAMENEGKWPIYSWYTYEEIVFFIAILDSLTVSSRGEEWTTNTPGTADQNRPYSSTNSSSTERHNLENLHTPLVQLSIR